MGLVKHRGDDKDEHNDIVYCVHLESLSLSLSGCFVVMKRINNGGSGEVEAMSCVWLCG